MHMIAGKLNFRRANPLKRVVAVAIILVSSLSFAFALSWFVNSAIGSYTSFVNRPPLYTYTSELGSISVSYPSSMLISRNKFGDDIELATIRHPFNTVDLTDSDIAKYNGLIFVETSREECDENYCSSRTVKDNMKLKIKTFLSAYSFEDPKYGAEQLKSRIDLGFKVDRKHEIREIDGQMAEYYSVEETGTGYYARDYSKKIMVLIPVGNILYSLNGHTSSYSYSNEVRDHTYLDKMVDSIRIDGTKDTQ